VLKQTKMNSALPSISG